MASFAPSLPAGTLNVALSNYAQAYRNNDFVGDTIAPRVPVGRQSFQYVIFDRSSWRNVGNDLRAPGAVPETGRTNYSTSPYFCRSHAKRQEIPFESEEYGLGLGFSTKQVATAETMDWLNLKREIYISGLAQTSGNWGASVSLSGTTMFDNAASDPVQTVQAGKDIVKQSGKRATHLILSAPVLSALKNNPAMKDRFKFTNATGDIDLAQLSSAFGVTCIEAAGLQLDKNDVASWIWGVGAFLAFAQPATDMRDVSAMKTFTWTAAPETVDGYGVLEFPKPDLDAKTDIVSCDWYWDTKVTAPATGYPILNCCAAPTMATLTAPAANY